MRIRNLATATSKIFWSALGSHVEDEPLNPHAWGTNSPPLHVTIRVEADWESAQGETGRSGTQPRQARVRVGGSVTWENHCGRYITLVNGDQGVDPNHVGDVFQSGLLSAGSSFSHTFDRPGTFAFFDPIHPWIIGVVRVVDPQADSTTLLTLASAWLLARSRPSRARAHQRQAVGTA